MRLDPKQERGFTLIEVLAAIVILSIVSLVLTSYFINAMSYSKSNQNKTIMVNLARNALFYMEKQDFDTVRHYFNDQAANGRSPEDSAITANTPIEGLSASLPGVLHPTVNGIAYQIRVVYQPGLLDNSDNPAVHEVDKEDLEAYLLPVKVEVKRDDAGNSPDYLVEVEGYISDETIR